MVSLTDKRLYIIAIARPVVYVVHIGTLRKKVTVIYPRDYVLHSYANTYISEHKAGL